MTHLSSINNLDQLWEYTNHIHKTHYPDSTLEPIMAGGKLHKPKYMFVFINPTHKNISSGSNWHGKRRPWIGTKYIWKIFNQAGHFDTALLHQIQKYKVWDVEFADEVYSHLEIRGFYFTNLVKWTGENADLPSSQMVKTFLPILLREIEIVQPEKIITFGLMPFNALIPQKIKLADYYNECVECNTLHEFDLELNGAKYSVIPCYFPVGRGNPKRASELLRLLD